jgi:hypothetical protein
VNEAAVDGAPTRLWSARRCGVVLTLGLALYVGAIAISGQLIRLRVVDEAVVRYDDHGAYLELPEGEGDWQYRPAALPDTPLPPSRTLVFADGRWRPSGDPELAADQRVLLLGERISLWRVLIRALSARIGHEASER